MIHPSYFELMDLVNKDVKEGEEPVVRSRYSIVLGTAKRARQIIDARHVIEEQDRQNNPESREPVKKNMDPKPLSVAVAELDEGEIHILRQEPEAEQSEDADEVMIQDDIDEELDLNIDEADEDLIPEESDIDEQ